MSSVHDTDAVRRQSVSSQRRLRVLELRGSTEVQKLCTYDEYLAFGLLDRLSHFADAEGVEGWPTPPGGCHNWDLWTCCSGVAGSSTMTWHMLGGSTVLSTLTSPASATWALEATTDPDSVGRYLLVKRSWGTRLAGYLMLFRRASTPCLIDAIGLSQRAQTDLDRAAGRTNRSFFYLDWMRKMTMLVEALLQANEADEVVPRRKPATPTVDAQAPCSMTQMEESGEKGPYCHCSLDFYPSDTEQGAAVSVSVGRQFGHVIVATEGETRMAGICTLAPA
jgi:hypothetical protein